MIYQYFRAEFMSKETMLADLRKLFPLLGGGLWMFFFLVLISCSEKTPEGILSRKEMAKTLTEFYLKESKINSLHVGHDSAMVLFQYFKQQYSEQNHLGDSVIDKSYRYYLDHPRELDEIYDIIIDSLSLKEQRALVPTSRPK